MDTNEMNPQQVNNLEIILEKSGANISYGIDGKPDEVMMNMEALIKYTDLVIFLTLDNYDQFKEEFYKDEQTQE